MGKKQQKKKKEYGIVKVGDKKYQFVKMLSHTEDTLTAINELSHIEGKRVRAEYRVEDVVLQLGSKPKYGRIYGCLIEPLRRTFDIEGWGEFHSYRPMKKVEMVALKQAVKRAVREMHKKNLQFVFPMTTEIRHKQGKYDGFYKISPHFDNTHNHMMCLKPQHFNGQDTVSLLRHELGHAVWFIGVTGKWKLKWIELYTYYMTLNTAKASAIKALRKGLEKSRNLKEFAASLEDEEGTQAPDVKASDALDECIDYIKSTFNLDNDEVELLIERSNNLEFYWPKHPFDISDSDPTVMTEYAMKNPREFFAEAFRLYMENSAPKTVKKLMVKTLSKLRK